MSIIYKNNEQILIEIKKIMLETKITQREIAHKLGIKPQGLTKLMNKKNFGFEDAQKILSAMGYDLIIDFKESLFERENTLPIADQQPAINSLAQQPTKVPDQIQDTNYKYLTEEDEKEIDLQRLLSDVRYKREIIGNYGYGAFNRLESKAKQQRE